MMCSNHNSYICQIIHYTSHLHRNSQCSDVLMESSWVLYLEVRQYSCGYFGQFLSDLYYLNDSLNSTEDNLVAIIPSHLAILKIHLLSNLSVS